MADVTPEKGDDAGEEIEIGELAPGMTTEAKISTTT